MLQARVGMAQSGREQPMVGCDDPEKKFIEAIAIYEKLSQPYNLARAYYYYARWLKFRGLTEESKNYYTKSREICEKIGVKFFR
ncbi:MAG TPA: hypothetical protein VF399_01200 [bacterium]